MWSGGLKNGLCQKYLVEGQREKVSILPLVGYKQSALSRHLLSELRLVSVKEEQLVEFFSFSLLQVQSLVAPLTCLEPGWRAIEHPNVSSYQFLPDAFPVCVVQTVILAIELGVFFNITILGDSGLESVVALVLEFHSYWNAFHLKSDWEHQEGVGWVHQEHIDSRIIGKL